MKISQETRLLSLAEFTELSPTQHDTMPAPTPAQYPTPTPPPPAPLPEAPDSIPEPPPSVEGQSPLESVCEDVIVGDLSLADMKKRLERANKREMSAYRQASQASARRHYDRVIVAELEKDTLIVADLISEARLNDAAEIAREMQQLRRELASLIGELRRGQTPELQRALMAALDRAERRMEALRQQLRAAMQYVPGEFVNRQSHQARQSTPFTPPVNALLGLEQALKELEKQGGWKSRRSRYTKLATHVARTCEELGVEPWLAAAESSCVLRSYHLPAGMTYNELHDGLKQQGFVIYAGQGDLAAQLFRISTMGEICDYDLARLEQALRIVIGG